MITPENKDIIFVIDNGLAAGGAERVASNLITAWVNDGRRVWLLSMKDSTSDFYSVPAAVTRVVFDRAKNSGNKMIGLAYNLVRIFKLRKALNSIKAETIVSFLTETNIRTLIASIGLGKKVVISERSNTVADKKHFFWTLLKRIFYPLAAIITANSKFSVEEMKSFLPSEKLAFVPNPVVIPAEKCMTETSRRIIHVGRLGVEKNQAFLIEAFAKISNAYPEWTLEFCGEGPDRSKLERLIEENHLQQKVFLRGLVSNMPAMYRTGAIFVLPSIFEGTPNALLEAMAFGLPAIVSDSLDGALEHLEDRVNGLVYRHGSQEHLVETLKVLMDSSDLRRQFGDAARQAMAKHGPEQILQVWDEIFTAALKNG